MTAWNEKRQLDSAANGLIASARHMLARYAENLRQRSAVIPAALSRRISLLLTAWALVFMLASMPRILLPASPVHSVTDSFQIVLPYLIIALAPLAGYHLATGSFPQGVLLAQPDIRLAFFGRWRRIGVLEARSNPAFGPAGFMASLLIGLLLNVVVRGFEFLVAMPAVNGHAPFWTQTLFHLMVADTAVMSFFYMICFVMALRSVPYFPRMLLFAWGLDITAQLIIAGQIGPMPGVPPQVAESLQHLLMGNIQKVLISAVVWLPYLILSERVNVTYRCRCSAR